MKKILGFAMLVLSLCMVGCFSQSKDDAEKNEEKLTKAVAPFTVDNAITVFYKRTKWTTSTNIHYNAGKFLSFTITVSETVSNFSYSGTSYPSVYPNMGYDVEIFYSNPKYCANPAKAYQSAANTMYIAYDNGTSWKEQVMDNSSSQSMWRIGEDGYNVARAYLSFNRVPWTKISFYIKDSNNVRDNNNSANYQITKPGKYLLINGYLLKI